MKLHEKILHCRKKAGLSQEKLAQLLGVSRQAVSKWELGDAEPEIRKLRELARVFGVTADWLLSDEDPGSGPEAAPPEPSPSPSVPHWVDTIPGKLGALLRRYGWLFGIYLILIGFLFSTVGGIAGYAAKQMFVSSRQTGLSEFMMPQGLPGDVVESIQHSAEGMIYSDPFTRMLEQAAARNPVVIMGTGFLIFGIILMVTGAVAAAILYRKGKAPSGA